MVKNWTPLHNHDEYSVLDGFSHPYEYLDRVLELGMTSFAITNHGNQMSYVYYAKLIKENEKYKNIKMIYGVEVYEAFDISIKDKDSKYFHLVLLAKNENGRRLLNEIVTRSSLEGFYYKPRIDLKTLKDLNCGNDLIVLSACLASKIARESDYNKCVQYIKEYKSIFPYFYLEMQSHKHIDQELYNKKILQLSRDTNTPYVITTDSHSATKEDLYYQGRHVQIAQDKETMSESYEGCYVQSINEIHETMDSQVGFNVVEVGLDNTNKIADMIDYVKMPFQEPQLPSYPLPKEFADDNEYLVYLVKNGWKTRRIDNLTEEEIKIRKERMEYELSVINQMKFDGYFIIVWDFINWAKENNIMVGAGRGSGAGSFVCYLLGITDLDPVKYNLIFQRFLNPERVSMPDLDIDLSDREPVVKYLTEKYGHSNVCQVINFNFITPLNAIRDAFKVCGIPYNIADKISKRFSFGTFEECLENNPHIYEEYPEYKEAFDIASKISGRVRGIGIHAGGVGIVDTTMSDYMGMVRGGKGEQVIQVDKKVIEEIGIIKFDLLGVKTLKLVQDVINDLGIDEWDINVNNDKFTIDEKSYNLLCEANTNAIFQVESTGMKDLLTRLQPRNLEELSAVIALYRPDSMGALEEFIECKHDSSKVTYIHEDMIPILEMTYGCMIYQEQLLDIVRKFGGRTYGGADKFRKGIGKKDEVLVKAESDKLYQEIIQTGYVEELAKTISDDMRSKGGYLFNKSHSFSYAVLCLQTAYLKSHYPLQFYKALFNLRKADGGKLNKYITDALNNNIAVIPPNINRSEMDFIIYNNKILFGLTSISGMGESAIIPLITERKNGKFISLKDLITRTGISESQIVSLIKSGAIPCKSKKNMLLKYANDYLLTKKEFTPLKSTPSPLSKLKEYGIDIEVVKDKNERLRLYNIAKEKEHIKNLNKKNGKVINEFEQKHMQDEEMWEFETLSIFLTHNPFDEVSKILTNYEEINDGSDVVIVGVISQTILKKNKRKQQYAFLNVCTAYGLVQVACWSTQYSMYIDHIKRGSRIAIMCRKQNDSYSIKELKPYNQWKNDVSNKLKLCV